MNLTKALKIAALCILPLILTACGGSDSDSTTLKTATFIDSAVEGLDFNCKGPTGENYGKTDSKGQFKYYANNICSFSLAGLAFGEVKMDSSIAENNIIMPHNIVENQDKEVMMASILQSLNTNQNAENGINVSKLTSLQGEDLPADLLDSKIDFESKFKQSTTAPEKFVSLDNAKKHLYKNKAIYVKVRTVLDGIWVHSCEYHKDENESTIETITIKDSKISYAGQGFDGKNCLPQNKKYTNDNIGTFTIDSALNKTDASGNQVLGFNYFPAITKTTLFGEKIKGNIQDNIPKGTKITSGLPLRVGIPIVWETPGKYYTVYRTYSYGKNKILRIGLDVEDLNNNTTKTTRNLKAVDAAKTSHSSAYTKQ